MELKVSELKKQIEKKSVSDSFLVLTYSDNSFLATHYVEGIAKAKNKTKVYIDDLAEVPSESLFGEEDDNLYILNTVKLEAQRADYKNTVVICKSIEESTKKKIIESGVLVELPKTQEWQVMDYAKYLCPGLDNTQLKWLYDVTSGNIYRLVNELNKITIFEPSEQSEIFMKINADGGYSDLSSLGIYDFTDAIIKKNVKGLSKIMTEMDNMDVESFGVITILHKNIKNIINIQMNPKATPESLGITDKQYKAVTYNLNKFKDNQLINIFEFLTSLDMRVKSGELQMTGEALIDYIVCGILSC